MSLSTPRTLEQTIAAIEALDLSMIKFKATRSEDGYGWSQAYADKMEIAYKRYLILHAKYPEMTIAPDQDTDRFWHMHILDTRKYAADCDATFGHFLHHFPYLGLRGDNDAKALEEAFAKMQALYAREFGEAMPGAAAQDDPAWCAAEAGKASPAWCAVESAQASPAWCAVESARASSAWCAVESAKASPAWCAVESAKASPAWCAVEAAQASPAWCAVEAKTSAAWCALETIAPTRAAWCAAESSQAPRTAAAA